MVSLINALLGLISWGGGLRGVPLDCHDTNPGEEGCLTIPSHSRGLFSLVFLLLVDPCFLQKPNPTIHGISIGGKKELYIGKLKKYC